ncbi:hypothetical protein SDC9_116403 [bioreactor metagenome]|uniref:Uncharacterized protein n=1 Tax=bioreactor metagenome TaxID=1076179 RepID=A0A645BWH9_9ZZZZ
MHHIPAAQDEDAIITKRHKPFSKGKVILGGKLRVHTERQNRHICGGEHTAKYRPSAVINSPMIVYGNSAPQQMTHAVSQLRRTFGGIFDLIEFFGETVHIVNHRGRLLVVDLCAAREPMRGDGHNRLRFFKRLPKRTPSAGIGIVFDCIHRRPVADKQCGHSVHHCLNTSFQMSCYHTILQTLHCKVHLAQKKISA